MSRTKTTDDFSYESTQDSRSIVKYLQALGEGFDSGRLLFVSGTDEMILKPRGLLQFVLKARRKDGKVKVSAEISWKERKSAKDSEEPRLRISIPGEHTE
jgi:amphi-Trp domain-containing protein